jgi:UDP-N-acetylglucosamine--N-acetylmuramyl-(pentapeptide) pyrophosphoryl-undecaprenol N-acetylglucosamine transferase
MPLRTEISKLDREALRTKAAKELGLDPNLTTLLVTGGSLGAKRINDTVEQSREALSQAGIQVLHILGARSELEPLSEGNYHRIKYLERMDYAFAAADFAVARSGAATVSEFACVGLPAVFVPYPVGNGEQRLNAADLVDSGAAIICLDADFTPKFVESVLIPLLSNQDKIEHMSELAEKSAIRDGAERLLNLVNGVLKR